MGDWEILISDGLEKNGLEILESRAHVSDQSGISSIDLQKILPEFDALIVRSRTKVTAELLECTTRLKVVGRAGVGVDNIDLNASVKRGVTIVNAPISTSAAVAELTIGLILGMLRQIPRADGALKTGSWIKKELVGSEAFGKKLGIIGMGHIGVEVASRATGLGISVNAHDPFLSDAEIIQRGANPLTLEQLLIDSDIITIHVPLSDTTRRLIDQTAFDRMKNGVYLVCTARGGIVDQQALLNALQSEKVAGAALDVFEQEPPGLTDLISHPRLIATPHIGAQTHEAQSRAANDIAEEVLAALDGQPLRWKIV